MELFLVRHGIAEEPALAEQLGRRDSERQLTAEGIARTERVARAFAKRVHGVEKIFHSPYVRARETAEVFGKEFPDSKVQPLDGLTPGDSPRRFLSKIESFSALQKVMLVGHEPNLSSLASLLLTGSEQPILEFRKAGICCLEWHGLGRCQLSYLLVPKFL